MFARVVLALALVLVASTGLASADACDVCDECGQALADDAAALVASTPVLDLPSPARPACVATLHGPHVSPALARVFRPPR